MISENLKYKVFCVLSYIIKKEMDPKNSVTFFREIDCTVIENIRNQYALQELKKPSYTSFIIKAVSQAIADHPFVNARIFPHFPYHKIFKFPEIHTAVACEKDMPGAEFLAFIDIIRNTDSKSIDAINRELISLANASVENNEQLNSFLKVIKNFPIFIARQLCTLPSIFPSMWMKYRGASIVVSSPSKYGVDSVSATWTHPLGLSFGLVQKKPMVKNNKVEPVLCFTLTLNWDRRIMAGAPAARFFNSIANYLTNRDFLIEHLEENISNKITQEPLFSLTA